MLFLIFTIFGLSGTAQSETLKTTVYQFEQPGTGKKQIYLFASGKEAIQLFVCGTKNSILATGLKGNANFDSLASKHCSPLFHADPTSTNRMMKGVRNGKIVSLHLGGTETPETKALAMMGDVKSWLAVFKVDTENDQSMLFTGVGIEVGNGLPRTDSVRVTLEKVAEGELEGSYPLLPLKAL